jgi:peroxiredoxin
MSFANRRNFNMAFADFGDDDFRPRRELLPSVTFKTRVRDDSIAGPNPYRWQDVTSWELFGGKRVIIFSLPGAFTPTCSTFQLPDFEKLYPEFKDLGIDEIYCISVNDSFVMNAWAKQQNIKNVKVIPDGSGEFTERMGMSIMKDNLGFGVRSWRYAVIANNGKIEEWFIEPGMKDNCETDPYGQTSPQNILDSLKNPKGQSDLPF